MDEPFSLHGSKIHTLYKTLQRDRDRSCAAPEEYVGVPLQLLTFSSDIAYPFSGRAQKLVLLCDENKEELILRGIHLASNGRIIHDIDFRKPKEKVLNEGVRCFKRGG